jgi:type IX secretion system PorP/SprF family membrane protein
MKKLILVIALFATLGVQLMKAQEKIIYNQYHFNYYLVNPAVAGAERCSHLMLTTKNQWLGIADAPSTQLLTYRTRVGESVGLGGYLYNDKNGQFSNIGGQFTFAYHIPMSDGRSYLINTELDRQLSFGVSVKMNQIAYNSVSNSVDPANADESYIVPNANFGIYYTSYGFFAGLSFTNLIPYTIDLSLEPVAPLTGYFFIGNSFEVIDRNTALEPSLMFGMNEYLNKQLDLNLKFSQDFPHEDFSYWLQMSYRHNLDTGIGQAVSLVPMAGLRFGKFNVGYAFNLSLTNMVNQNVGTHELMLGYTFCVPKHFCR